MKLVLVQRAVAVVIASAAIQVAVTSVANRGTIGAAADDRPAAVELLTQVLGLGPEDVVRLPDDGQDVDLEILLGGDYNTCR